MAEKYEDLIVDIKNDDTFDMTAAEIVGARVALQWIDQNRGQTPGRTITRRDFERAFDFHFDDEDIDRHERFLAHLGITVVPDPKPTNAENLADYVRQMGRTAMSAEECGRWLDEQGVKAPGGDDESDADV